MIDLEKQVMKRSLARAALWSALFLLALGLLWIANQVLPVAPKPLPRENAPPPRPIPSARVEKVFDGDTLLLEGGTIVRLKGIDTPEQEQIGHERARETLRTLVAGKTVHLAYDLDDTADRFGRLLAYLSPDTCASVNERLIETGWAWIYRMEQGSERWESFLESQRTAMKEKRGLWSELTDPAGPFHGSRNSHIFHKPSCAHGKKISSKNRARFDTLHDAFWQGYSPCRSCFRHPIEGR
jgi:micrococcal nuclease